LYLDGAQLIIDGVLEENINRTYYCMNGSIFEIYKKHELDGDNNLLIYSELATNIVNEAGDPIPDIEAYWDELRIAGLYYMDDVFNSLPPGGGGGDTITDVRTDDTIDFYYRGYNRNGDWVVEQFAEDDISNFLSATEANNGGVTTLNLAWTDRLILNYI
jgi:hypothetical protein